MSDGFGAALLSRAVPWLLTYLLHSTALVVGAWALTRWGRIRRPRTLHLLWLTALFAGGITATLAVLGRPGPPGGLSVRTGDGKEIHVLRAVDPAEGASPSGGTAWVAAIHRTPTGPADRTPTTATAGFTRVAARTVRTSAACNRALHAGGAGGEPWMSEVRRTCNAADRGGWHGFFVVLWLAGAFGALAAGLLRRRAMHVVLAREVPVKPETAEVFQGVARRAGVSARVVVCDAVDSPCALAGRVLLPPRCEAELAPAELEAVLAHEVAHLARRDHRWAALADGICRLFWFQPLNRIAAAELRLSAEFACDEWAVRQAPALDLARAIHRVAEWSVGGGGASAVPALARGRGGPLVRRVARILGGRRREGRLARWVGVALVSALLAATTLIPAVGSGRAVALAVFVERGARLP